MFFKQTPACSWNPGHAQKAQRSGRGCRGSDTARTLTRHLVTVQGANGSFKVVCATGASLLGETMSPVWPPSSAAIPSSSPHNQLCEHQIEGRDPKKALHRVAPNTTGTRGRLVIIFGQMTHLNPFTIVRLSFTYDPPMMG